MLPLHGALVALHCECTEAAPVRVGTGCLSCGAPRDGMQSGGDFEMLRVSGAALPGQESGEAWASRGRDAARSSSAARSLILATVATRDGRVSSNPRDGGVCRGKTQPR